VGLERNEDAPDQDDGVIANHHRDAQSHRGVMPIPAARGQNDRSSDGDTAYGSRVR
jgi:hypothetical protein